MNLRICLKALIIIEKFDGQGNYENRTDRDRGVPESQIAVTGKDGVVSESGG